MLTNAVNTNKKTEELFIYITDKLKDNSNYGATLLNKIFYFVDCASYLKNKKPISNFTYIKQDFGHTPNPADFLRLRDGLLLRREIKEERKEVFGFYQKRYIPQREPNLSFFEKEEIILIDDVINTLSNLNATQISEFSHTFMAWKFAKNKEELPLFTFLLSKRNINEDDVRWAKESIRKYKSLSDN